MSHQLHLWPLFQSYLMCHLLHPCHIACRTAPTPRPKRIHQFGKKVLPGIFLGYELIAGGIWKGDILTADVEEFSDLDASAVYPRRIDAC